jgi:hypothetical protein
MREFGQPGQVIPVNTFLHPQGNKQFLKRGISRPFTNPVNGGVKLESTCFGGGDRVCHCTTHVIVTVGAEWPVNRGDKFGHDPAHL